MGSPKTVLTANLGDFRNNFDYLVSSAVYSSQYQFILCKVLFEPSKKAIDWIEWFNREETPSISNQGPSLRWCLWCCDRSLAMITIMKPDINDFSGDFQQVLVIVFLRSFFQHHIYPISVGCYFNNIWRCSMCIGSEMFELEWVWYAFKMCIVLSISLISWTTRYSRQGSF